MTLDQFRILDEMEKVSAIMQFGRLMAQDVDSDNRIFLYRLEAFYVSASYSSNNDNLHEITCFLEMDEAAPHFRKQLIQINPAERAYHLPETLD